MKKTQNPASLIPKAPSINHLLVPLKQFEGLGESRGNGSSSRRGTSERHLELQSPELDDHVMRKREVPHLTEREESLALTVEFGALVRYPKERGRSTSFSSEARGQGQCYASLGITGTQAVAEARRKNAYWSEERNADRIVGSSVLTV